MHRLALSLLLLPFLLAPLPEAAPQQGESRDGLSDANRAAAILLRERLRRDRPDDYDRFCRIGRRDVLVVRGRYDRVERVLEELQVPYTAVAPEDLARARIDGHRALIVNCPGEIGDAGVRVVRRFVERGGFLFSTDWAVLNVLEPAFPGTVRYTGRPTRDDVVAIRIVRPEEMLLRHVLTGADRHLWWLENKSYPFTVLDPRRVDVLIESDEMREKYGAGPVAAAFSAGRGRVVHIVSHFYLQRGELRTERDRLSARAFAGDLGFAPGAPAVRELAEKGLADLPAGEMRSAYSAQQFLANLLVTAMRAERPEPPPADPVSPESPPVRPDAPSALTVREVTLRDGPEGGALKTLPAGLPLRVLAERDGWLMVVTRAGTTGWLRAADVAL
ncbi:MAG: SH3 domain-containing protein [Planctomycetes bacterium]|jgi:hypothetical protein|nr:SH3 domain-containing protein [Planctomycetota bacterium]